MKKLLFVLVMVLLFSIPVSSQIFEHTFDIEFTEAMIHSYTDYQGNDGQLGWFSMPIETFAVNTGDIVRTQINLVTPVMLIQVPGSLYFGGDERFWMEYKFVEDEATTTVRRAAVTLDVTAGDAVVTQYDDYAFHVTEMGFGFGEMNHGDNGNLTDSFIVLSGMYIDIEITDISAPRTVDTLELSFYASDIALVPEPGTMLLLGLGGMLLRRKAMNSE